MFCLDEPDRHPSFSAANDRTLAFAERSERAADPVRAPRPERVADRGGAPLPRRRRARDQAAPARAEVRWPADERLAPVFELAAEHRVPILIHGGRGLPPIADGPAHARRPLSGGDADHRARRHRRPRRARDAHGGPQGRALRHVDVEPGRPARLLPPGPARAGASTRATTRTGSSRRSLLIALKTAIARRLRRRPAARDARRQRERTRRRPASCPSRRRRSASDTLSQPMQLARIHQYLSMATPLLWMRQPDTIGVLGLAINACAERNGHVDEVDAIRELLDRRARALGGRAGRSRTRPSSATRSALTHPADPHRRHRGGHAQCLS